MAFWNFVIYHVSDFSTLDWNSGATTNATITPIYITIEDDDGRFGQQGSDGRFLQTISSSSVPSLVGQNIYYDVNGSATQLWDTSSGTLMMGVVRIGGLTNWVVATQDGVNTTLSPSTTYNEDLPVTANLGLDYVPAALACFTIGTRILTPMGHVPIESLSVGDLVSTADHGPQAIQWIGQRTVTAAEMARDPKLRPIRIKAGAMGNGLPRRDLLVSRQHRMLLRSAIVTRLFGRDEVLVPAAKLPGLPGISVDDKATDITYMHILCHRHEVLFAEHCPAELLYPGPRLTDPGKAEAADLFGTIPADTLPVLPARLLAQGKRVTRLVERHVRNGKPPLAMAPSPMETA